jgi:hypothetical protein
MNEKCRTAKCVGVLLERDIDWHFRVYLMQSDPEELIDCEALFDLLEEKTRVVATKLLSSEFSYIRSGFVLAHYGRRGVTWSFWHWADWSGTWEFMCQAWYCYGRALEEMTLLDRTEPILCQHEITVVMDEAVAFRRLAQESADLQDLVYRYRNIRL